MRAGLAPLTLLFGFLRLLALTVLVRSSVATGTGPVPATAVAVGKNGLGGSMDQGGHSKARIRPGPGPAPDPVGSLALSIGFVPAPELSCLTGCCGGLTTRRNLAEIFMTGCSTPPESSPNLSQGQSWKAEPSFVLANCQSSTLKKKMNSQRRDVIGCREYERFLTRRASGIRLGPAKGERTASEPETGTWHVGGIRGRIMAAPLPSCSLGPWAGRTLGGVAVLGELPTSVGKDTFAVHRTAFVTANGIPRALAWR